MPTPSEQKALAFVAIVILLGGAVRVVRAGAADVPTPFEQQALARQTAATDSAAAASRDKPSRRKRPALRLSRDTAPNVVGGVASVPLNRLGFPPPSPTITTAAPGVQPATRRGTGGTMIDLDVASAREMESLPRIGPSFAARIVANRDSLGPFGSLDGLERVKGIGKATRTLLAPLVTFSGVARAPPNR